MKYFLLGLAALSLSACNTTSQLAGLAIGGLIASQAIDAHSDDKQLETIMEGRNAAAREAIK